MKSRIFQLVLLIVLFFLGVMTINSCSTTTSSDGSGSAEGYIPPSP